jgi:hypothetical protein
MCQVCRRCHCEWACQLGQGIATTFARQTFRGCMDSLSAINVYPAFAKDTRIGSGMLVFTTVYPTRWIHIVNHNTGIFPTLKLVGLQKAVRSVLTYTSSQHRSARLFLETNLEEDMPPTRSVMINASLSSI